MGCDWTVHIWDKSKFDEDVLKCFKAHSMGSRYFNILVSNNYLKKEIEEKYNKDAYEIIGNTPQYEIGEVSFLKRAVFGSDDFLYGHDEYIELFEGDPEPITDRMIEMCRKVDEDLAKFLEKHKEHQVFTVCW